MQQITTRTTSVLVLSALWLAACGSSENNPRPLDPVTPAPAVGTIGDGRLAQLVDWARTSQDLPAMGAVVIRDGQIVETAVAGVRSADASVAVSAQDRWHLGSLTKAMTATLAAVLVEQGMIDWDTTVAEVWPQFADIHPQFQDIELRQLLSHTSGMQRDDNFGAGDDDAPGTPMTKRRSWAERLLARAPAYPSGVTNYSNMGYLVAGAMLEERSGIAWETLLTNYLFAPLGMAGCGFGAPGTAGQLDQPLGHLEGGRQPVPVGPGADNPRAIGPAGTVHCALEDYGRFLAAHIAGARGGTTGIVSAASFTMLHTPVAPGYALGWGVQPYTGSPADTVYSHNGSNLRWFASTWFLPGHDTGVLLVTNSAQDRGESAIRALNDLVRERINASP